MRIIPVYSPWLSAKVNKYVLECLESGWISSQGPFVTMFERHFSQFCGAAHGIATCNGTAALHLALRAAGVKRGDEVILPALTFVATANAVSYASATPVIVDVDPVTWTLDPDAVRRHITPRTKAVIAVHLYGHPADMDPLVSLAREHGLWLIEDAAQAHGATYKMRRVGGIGHIACFSFYGNKLLTTGEGGMVVTSDAALAERASFFRDHAMDRRRRYYHTEVGFNYRMSSLLAAVGVALLEDMETILDKSRAVARMYREGLGDLDGVTHPPEMAWATNVFWMYSVLVGPSFGRSRDELMALLEARGIDTRPFFVPLHRLPPYWDCGAGAVAEGLSRRGMNLPSGAGLSRELVERVCTTLRELRCRS